MTDSEYRLAAKQFAEDWRDKNNEKQHTQAFWLTLLQKVFGIDEPDKYISFEEPVKISETGYIDGYILNTKVLIEQKSGNVDLGKGYKQSDGSMLTPYQQARRYAGYLPHDKNPRWIVVCNFKEFRIHDMNRPNDAPDVVLLENLEKEYSRLLFLTDTGNEDIKTEMEVSLKAGELVGVLYDALLRQYKDPESDETLKSLNALCVRLVFCLYAEDAGIFGKHGMFHSYMKDHVKDARRALIDLFDILNRKENERDPYIDEDLAAFPYVNGNLFEGKVIIPKLDENIVNLIIERASADFDWSSISPTIFGAVFESTLNPETRRSGGMHYTSIENIHKVIDPLFLDDLKKELDEIKQIGVERTRKARLQAFQQKLARLTFLDPACGSGNFLTETYISIRRLENEVLRMITDQIVMGDFINPVKVSINQFYGIEINDFAVTVAKTALWIAESQMLKETENIVRHTIDFLPLKTNAHIVEGNALRIDWETVVPKNKLNYIMGNPPFVGHQNRTANQIKDMEIAFYDLKKHGKLDYVCGWYNKACDYMRGTHIQTAFVSTNSIAQGESVALLWKFMFSKNVEIQFAHRSFPWESESNEQATVHCVIVGFSCYSTNKDKKLYENNRFQLVDHINGYLVSAPDVFIESRGKQLTEGIPEIVKGSQATDGGNLFLTAEERAVLIKQHPQCDKFIKRFVGAEEFINNKMRYCLWLRGVDPSEYRNIQPIRERLERITEIRSKSPTASVQKDAATPMLFTQIRQPETDYLIVPRHSSEGRKYIPLGYMSRDVICGDANMLIPNATLSLFGILTSNVHMAWMRTVCGRLEMRYRYTPAIYNNFPWCNPTDEKKKKIEETAQAILDARAMYPNCSLSDLYDEITMPPELRKAHQSNDRAVMRAYGFDVKTMTEASCVAELMKMYQKLTK